jgi:hypothetical protein
VDIRATPEQIWPWLLQMGQGRGGFYSYDWLERLCGFQITNTEEIIPALQKLVVGDGIRLHPKAPALDVVKIEAPRYIVLAGGHALQPNIQRDRSPLGLHTYPSYTWQFVLQPIAGGTRMLVRDRVAWNSGVLGWVRLFVFFELAHTIMQRGMNAGLKERVERMIVGGKAASEGPRPS